MQEKKSWGLFKFIFICCFAQFILVCAKIIGAVSFTWPLVFIPLLFMYVGIFAYMGIAILFEYIREYQQSPHKNQIND